MGAYLARAFVDPETIPETAGGFFQLIFLGVAYAFVLFKASNLIKDGSELLLLVPSLEGVVGSIVLPILGSVPDGAIVLFSGLGDNAQHEVTVGVGALAGSTVMLLTIPWTLAIWGGRVRLINGEPEYKKPADWAETHPGERFFKLGEKDTACNTGFRVGHTIRKTSFVMLVTLIPYLVIQIPAAVKHCALKAGTNYCESPEVASIVGAIVAIVMFCGYLGYQVVLAKEGDDIVKEAKMEGVRQSAVRYHFLSLRGLFPDLHKFVDEQGKIPLQVGEQRLKPFLRPIFNSIDKDRSGFIEVGEFMVAMRDIGERLNREQAAELFQAIDTGHDHKISLDEFVVCVIEMLTNREQFLDKISASVDIQKLAGEDPEATSQRLQAREAADTEGAGAAPVTREDDMGHLASPTPNLTPSADSGEATAKTPLISVDPTEEDKKEVKSKAKKKDKKPKKKEGGEDGHESDDGEAEEEEIEEEEEEEEVQMPEEFQALTPQQQQKRILIRSFSYMTFGLLVVLVFSDPMVDIFTALGTFTHIPSFYIAFVLGPIASNASELIAAYGYALKKTEKTITISLASLLGGVCMNNTFCLAIFQFLIFGRKLKWEFTAETIAIIVAELSMMFFSWKKVQPAYYCFIIISVFPLTIVLVAVLEYVGLD